MLYWPAALEILDARIAAGEPLTQDLMHDYRDRDDHLLNDAPFLKFVVSYGVTAQVAGGSITLDNSIDWRDRFIRAMGLIIWCADVATAQSNIPGGANDNLITIQRTVAGPDDYLNIENAWMYTEDGSAGLDPRCAYTSVNFGHNAIIWVDQVTGNLMLYLDGAAPSQDNQAYNITIWYTDDQGFY